MTTSIGKACGWPASLTLTPVIGGGSTADEAMDLLAAVPA